MFRISIEQYCIKTKSPTKNLTENTTSLFIFQFVFKENWKFFLAQTKKII